MSSDRSQLNKLRHPKSPSDVAAGGTVGGLLIFLTNTYITDPNFKSILIYCIPMFAVFVASLWATLQDAVVGSYRMRKAETNIIKAKVRLASIERDPKATEAHKRAVRAELERAEAALVKATLADGAGM